MIMIMLKRKQLHRVALQQCSTYKYLRNKVSYTIKDSKKSYLTQVFMQQRKMTILLPLDQN